MICYKALCASYSMFLSSRIPDAAQFPVVIAYYRTMRCFIGLLLCVCVALRLTEGLVCLKCTNKAEGVACYNNGTSSKSCIDGLGFQCVVNVGYKKSKGSGGKWQRSDIARGCHSPKVTGCVKSDQRCDCYRFCEDDNCNGWSTPDSPSSPDWGSNNNC